MILAPKVHVVWLRRNSFLNLCNVDKLGTLVLEVLERADSEATGGDYYLSSELLRLSKVRDFCCLSSWSVC